MYIPIWFHCTVRSAILEAAWMEQRTMARASSATQDGQQFVSIPPVPILETGSGIESSERCAQIVLLPNGMTMA